ncbi:protein phosphatase 1 regulatory subunit 14A isoform X2 [Alligator mississippiensis]|uniref:protein phosphatase 1 regulatory subunit 14A isoform X2 n=1 Tax=Alligator mississippiensis TaxID=8496 RepID=UPI0028777238|nr:protein phosphatase 1 regulatory subunit 14A isoform X2 [Alligator mississippiensis]
MAANRVGRRLGRGSPARALGAPRPEPARSPGLQRRHARVTVKYNRRELQRRLDTEKWIDGCLEELYRGREAEMPDEVNIDELLELDTDEERARKLQDFVRELLLKLRGLQKQQALQQPSPDEQELQDHA